MPSRRPTTRTRAARRAAMEERRLGRENEVPCRTCGGPPEIHEGMEQGHSYRPEEQTFYGKPSGKPKSFDLEA